MPYRLIRPIHADLYLLGHCYPDLRAYAHRSRTAHTGYTIALAVLLIYPFFGFAIVVESLNYGTHAGFLRSGGALTVFCLYDAIVSHGSGDYGLRDFRLLAGFHRANAV